MLQLPSFTRSFVFPRPSGREVILDPHQVDGRPSSRGAPNLLDDRAGDGIVLEVKGSGGALDVDEVSGPVIFLHTPHRANQCPSYR